MKIYNAIGYLIILLYMLACLYFAPTHLGPWAGLQKGPISQGLQTLTSQV